MRLIIDNEYIKINVLEKKTNNVVLCFTGVGHAMGGIDVQNDEFFSLTKNATVIFITDKARSWGNNLNFEFIKELIFHYIQNKKIFAIGNSMGGFLAIIASKYFKFDTVIAFSPQFSVKKSIVPRENRWLTYIEDIKHWQFDSVEDYFDENCQYYIFSVGYGMDGMQVDYFPKDKNIHKIIILNKEWGHSVANELKKINVLYEVINACLEHQLSSDIKKIIM